MSNQPCYVLGQRCIPNVLIFPSKAIGITNGFPLFAGITDILVQPVVLNLYIMIYYYSYNLTLVLLLYF